MNGHQVLNKSYGQVEKLILAGNSFERLDIRVFERVGDDDTSEFPPNSSVSSVRVNIMISFFFTTVQCDLPVDSAL